MEVAPDLDRFLELARDHAVVPVWTEVLGDETTSVAAFQDLAGDGPGFLLESVEGGERWARWSFVGWDPLFVLSMRDGAVELEGLDLEVHPEDPLRAVEDVLAHLDVPETEGMPPLHSGMVGYLGYDAVRYIENLPNPPPDDRGLPDMLWLGVGMLAAFDRFRQTVRIVCNVAVSDDPGADHAQAVAALGGAVAALGSSRRDPPPGIPRLDGMPAASPSLTREGFLAAASRARDHVHAGDVFQVVPSIRYEVDFGGDAFTVYRVLRVLNPSPYMFFVRGSGVSLAGSSPELMVRVRDGRIFSRPIAGTRRRGATDEEDAALETDLLADPKEVAEHVMLVDLARNDLGRVCEFGSVGVDDLMTIERYSHVMHIVSGVSGRLRGGVGPVEALRATFPHGTVTGAPKIRAMEIIDDLEPVARGPYAGAVGYVDFSGNMDTAIALRTMVSADGKAWAQAGAGVVADSIPEREFEECGEKAAVVLAALAAVGDE